MTSLTTHVLDTARGIPAAGIQVDVHLVRGTQRELVASAVTNDHGRTENPLLSEDAFTAGTYELSFHIEPYFAGTPGVPDPPFLDVITIRVTIIDPSLHHHVPLLASPWAYSTYRGS